MIDTTAGPQDSNEPDDRPEAGEPRPVVHARPTARGRGGGLRFYKPGQGYYTRMFTAVGASLLVLWGAAALFGQLSSLMSTASPYRYPVSYGVTVAFVLGLGGVIYWLVGLSRRPNDFFIATEGEMKKVSWSSRKDVVRSTKVVIASVVMLAALLFLADLFFMFFFSKIGVLKAFSGVGIGALFGGGSDGP
ncbi:MAG: preprotein translocase subunit SecE [Phycisphaerae bacterium]